MAFRIVYWGVQGNQSHSLDWEASTSECLTRTSSPAHHSESPHRVRVYLSRGFCAIEACDLLKELLDGSGDFNVRMAAICFGLELPLQLPDRIV